MREQYGELFGFCCRSLGFFSRCDRQAEPCTKTDSHRACAEQAEDFLGPF